MNVGIGLIVLGLCNFLITQQSKAPYELIDIYAKDNLLIPYECIQGGSI